MMQVVKNPSNQRAKHEIEIALVKKGFQNEKKTNSMN